jgi:hypothetical protein
MQLLSGFPIAMRCDANIGGVPGVLGADCTSLVAPHLLLLGAMVRPEKGGALYLG